MLLDFFKAVLPASGFYCLVLLPEGRHIWTDSLETLALRATQHEGRPGVYFGTAAFKSSDTRKAVNVLALRSLRLDIDAGAKKHEKDPTGTYPSQRDALTALMGFIRETQLAPSHIVSSGEGLHVYYSLDEDLEPARWTNLAEALHASCEAHGLRVDPTVTRDSARILRPLGGLHSGERRVSLIRSTGKVYSEADLSEALGALPAPTQRKYDTSINDEVTLTVEGPPSSALKIVDHCAALCEVADAAGDVQEPFWRAMLGLVKFTVEGDKQAHEWSMGYSGYSEKETNKKLAAWETGPSTCAEFGKHTSACDGCKHKGKIKSPIVLGRMTSEQIEQLPEEKRPAPLVVAPPTGDPWDGALSEGYAVKKTKDGKHLLVANLTVEVESDTGESVPIRIEVPFSHDVFWFSNWADAENEQNAGAVITLHKYDEKFHRVKAFEFPMQLLATRSDLGKKLAEFGIMLTTDKRAPLAMDNYTRAQMERIKNSFRRVRIQDRFGMRIVDDGSLVCAHGRHVIYPDGTVRHAILGNDLRAAAQFFALPVPEAFSGEWGPEVWDTHILPAARQHADFMRKHYSVQGMEKFQLAFMLGLSSPLMPFTSGDYLAGSQVPGGGLAVSLYESKGARGKTTLMRATALAFGRAAELSKDQNETSSTELARVAKLAMWGTMPAAFDEMGKMGEKAASTLISAVANGTMREQATKTMGLKSGGRWSLVCLMSTNKSLRDMLAAFEGDSAPVQNRLLELEVKDIPDYNRDQVASFTTDWADVQNCAGALGAVIERELCALGVGRANKLVMDCVNRAAQLVNAVQDERYQFRALGAVLATQLILKKLGLDVFSTRALLACFQDATASTKEYVKDNVLTSDPIELLEKFLNDIRADTVVTRVEGDANTPAFALNPQMPREIKGRFIKDKALRLYFSADAFDKWCLERRVRGRDVIDACKEKGLFTPIIRSAVGDDGQLLRLKLPFNLTKGLTTDITVNTKCYCISMARLALLQGRHVQEIFEVEEQAA
jgi:hypothetical protein